MSRSIDRRGRLVDLKSIEDTDWYLEYNAGKDAMTGEHCIM
jgi:hypothetical protein